ncbi:MAG: DUF1446 domain-containing protein [Actinomycetota bacterium]|nr:DUF1446 domain-containing protein [Actinomycetota bacterium]
MREMLDGGPVDVITGDYLAELTMLILGRDQLKDPALGYARTFVTQVEDCLGSALERGVRIVSNAGGLNPAGLAGKLRDVARGLGLDPVIAHVEGDNLTPRAAELGLGDALTANAYLGGFGISEALLRGADVVVTGRVTDASVVVGPAIAHFGWTPSSYDELAGAVAAGHVIECGTQATGGNFSGFLTMKRDATQLGFPIAEIDVDGSSVITKHDGTGGLVSVDTVTAQLVYEVQSAHYLNPDVTLDLSSIRLTVDGPDRVRISGVSGLEPPRQLKVAVNELGGHRNQMEFVLVGLDIEEKAAWVREQLEARLAAHPPESVTWSLGRPPVPGADTEEGASCLLRVTVKDPSADVVGKAFSAAAVELALASYPGFTMTAPPGRGSPYGIYRAAYVDRSKVEQVVVMPGGPFPVVEEQGTTVVEERGTTVVEERGTTVVEERGTSVSKPVSKPPPRWLRSEGRASRNHHHGPFGPFEPFETVAAQPPQEPTVAAQPPQPAWGPTRRVPFGTFFHARSGDKGGDANIGVWVGEGDKRAERVAWLLEMLTPDRVRELLPESRDLDVEVFALPNLGAVNVLVRGLLGDGVAASTRFDPQAKAVAEWLRSRPVEIPEELL